jgi:hypothetical protein
MGFLTNISSLVDDWLGYLLHPIASPVAWDYPIPKEYTHLVMPAIVLEALILIGLLVVLPAMLIRHREGGLGLAISSYVVGLTFSAVLLVSALTTARFDVLVAELVSIGFVIVVSIVVILLSRNSSLRRE